MRTYARHAVSYGDRCQAGAIIEGIDTYARHAVRDGHGGQTCAAGEGTIIYARHAVGDDKVCHQYTIQIQIVCIV